MSAMTVALGDEQTRRELALMTPGGPQVALNVIVPGAMR